MCSFPESLQNARCLSSLADLPETHKMLQKSCRDFVDNELIPIAGKLDKEHTYPKDVVKYSGVSPKANAPQYLYKLQIWMALIVSVLFILISMYKEINLMDRSPYKDLVHMCCRL